MIIFSRNNLQLLVHLMNVQGLLILFPIFFFVVKFKNFINREQILKLTTEYGEELFKHFNHLHSLIVTIGKHGIVYFGPSDDLDRSIMCNNNLILNSKVFLSLKY